jgi:hypothetical protein
MKRLILKIGFVAFIVFAITHLLGDKLAPFYNMFPDPETVRESINAGSIIAIFASLAIVVVRTILGILSILFVAAVIYIILRTNLFDTLLKSIQ